MKKFDPFAIPCGADALCGAIINKLNGLESAVGVYGCDLHSFLFNSESLFLWLRSAKNALLHSEVEVFRLIELVKAYERFNFGEVSQKTDPDFIANMVGYIVGQEILANSQHLNGDCWDNELTAEDLEIIADELHDYLTVEVQNRDLVELVCNSYEV